MQKLRPRRSVTSFQGCLGVVKLRDQPHQRGRVYALIADVHRYGGKRSRLSVVAEDLATYRGSRYGSAKTYLNSVIAPIDVCISLPLGWAQALDFPVSVVPAETGLKGHGVKEYSVSDRHQSSTSAQGGDMMILANHRKHSAKLSGEQSKSGHSGKTVRRACAALLVMLTFLAVGLGANGGPRKKWCYKFVCKKSRLIAQDHPIDQEQPAHVLPVRRALAVSFLEALSHREQKNLAQGKLRTELVLRATPFRKVIFY